MTPAAPDAALLQDRVDQLVRAHRVRGHMIAKIDPLGLPRPGVPELDPGFFGLSDSDMDRPVSSGTMQWEGTPTLRRILERLRNTYCRYIGVQYMHIHDLEARRWLRDRMESTENRLSLSREQQLRILTRLSDATVFEEFLQKKYPGAKTFSLEARRASSRCSSWRSSAPPTRASTRSCSRWRTAEGSTFSRTSSARARARSSASSRTWTRTSTAAAAT
jgi:2-oxoglutarate dehydrogenase E1 component